MELHYLELYRNEAVLLEPLSTWRISHTDVIQGVG